MDHHVFSTCSVSPTGNHSLQKQDSGYVCVCSCECVCVCVCVSTHPQRKCLLCGKCLPVQAACLFMCGGDRDTRGIILINLLSSTERGSSLLSRLKTVKHGAPVSLSPSLSLSLCFAPKLSLMHAPIQSYEQLGLKGSTTLFYSCQTQAQGLCMLWLLFPRGSFIFRLAYARVIHFVNSSLPLFFFSFFCVLV